MCAPLAEPLPNHCETRTKQIVWISILPFPFLSLFFLQETHHSPSSLPTPATSALPSSQIPPPSFPPPPPLPLPNLVFFQPNIVFLLLALHLRDPALFRGGVRGFALRALVFCRFVHARR
ncbi:unnamed protein product [Periconia digitata]|uniref:Uncharacterized protein n=1 Tax=Periconia digitata TaxID=1303443 RepID=A0A9W4UJN0_9PLEO|nr:unnamed protein product [Periconia digitata]